MLEIISAWRGLRRGLRGVLLAILTLAVASAAMALVFTVINAVLLRPLPLSDAHHLAIVWEKRQSEAGKYGVSGADFFDWQRGATGSVESMTAQDERPMILGPSGWPGPERVLAILSTPGLLETFGASPLLGRPIPNGELHEALLSFGLWQRRFGGDASVIGRAIRLDGVAYTVAGVLPAEFRMFLGRGGGDVFIPLDMPPRIRQSRDDHTYLVTARLRSSASFEQLSAELSAVNARLQRDFPRTNSGHDALVVPLTREVTEGVRPALWMLLGAVSLLMLLACSNVANLLLARNSVRAGEFAIRRALGARWSDTARVVLAESAMLAVAACVAGIVVARLAIPAMQAIVPKTIGPVILPGMDRLELDWRVALFSVGSCLAIALLCAIEPLRGMRLDHMTQRRFGTPSASRARRMLAVAQVAIACLLVTSAAAFVTSYIQLMQVSPGFLTNERLVANLSGGRPALITDAISHVPGVRSAAVASIAPGRIGGPRTGIRLATDPPPQTIEQAKKAFFRIVTPGLMKTAGIPILQGREFDLALDSEKGTRSMIVSRTLVDRYFRGQDLIGKSMLTPIDDKPWTVVGIVGDVRQLGLDRDAYPEMYFPLAQWSFDPIESYDITIEGRSVNEAALRRAVAEADPGTAVSSVRPVSGLLEESVAPRYFQTTLTGAFAVIALWIALSGLYAVIEFLVLSRKREIGVRMALGATPWQVLRMVLREGAILGVLGCALGLGGAFALHQVLSQFLIGVSVADPLVVAGTAALLMLVTLAASLAPGASAYRTEPASVLRTE